MPVNATLDVSSFARRWRGIWRSSRLLFVMSLFAATFLGYFLDFHRTGSWDEALATITDLMKADPTRSAEDAAISTAFTTDLFNGLRTRFVTEPYFFLALSWTIAALLILLPQVIGRFRLDFAWLAFAGLLALTGLAVRDGFLAAAGATVVSDRFAFDFLSMFFFGGLTVIILLQLVRLTRHRLDPILPPTSTMTTSLGANLGIALPTWGRLSASGVAVQTLTLAALAGAIWLYGTEIAHAVLFGVSEIGINVLQAAVSVTTALSSLVAGHGFSFRWGTSALSTYVDDLPRLILVLAAGGVLFAGWRYGERLNRTARNALILKDQPPVLLLRSFMDDHSGIKPNSLVQRLALRRKRLEECIGEELSRAGPFVAVGKPGETLPPLGAERVYLGDDDWQGVVRDLIAKSDPIILIAGTTPWVRWELASILGQSRLERAVIVFPPMDDGARRDRWENLKPCFEGTGHAAAAAALNPADTLALVPTADGRFVQLTSGSVRESDYEAALRVAIYLINEHARRKPVAGLTLGSAVVPGF